MELIVWELILVAVVALGLGFWQLRDVNRELRKERDKAGHASADRNNDSAPNVDSQQNNANK